MSSRLNHTQQTCAEKRIRDQPFSLSLSLNLHLSLSLPFSVSLSLLFTSLRVCLLIRRIKYAKEVALVDRSPSRTSDMSFTMNLFSFMRLLKT